MGYPPVIYPPENVLDSWIPPTGGWQEFAGKSWIGDLNPVIEAPATKCQNGKPLDMRHVPGMFQLGSTWEPVVNILYIAPCTSCLVLATGMYL